MGIPVVGVLFDQGVIKRKCLRCSWGELIGY